MKSDDVDLYSAMFETFVAEMKDRNVRNRRQGVRASR